jgi:hypothetical protein
MQLTPQQCLAAFSEDTPSLRARFQNQVILETADPLTSALTNQSVGKLLHAGFFEKPQRGRWLRFSTKGQCFPSCPLGILHDLVVPKSHVLACVSSPTHRSLETVLGASLIALVPNTDYFQLGPQLVEPVFSSSVYWHA